MKNRLSDLNDHLFAQMERLSEEGLSGDRLEEEVRRTQAIVGISDQIVGNAKLRLNAVKAAALHGDQARKNLGGILDEPKTLIDAKPGDA